MLTGIYTLPIRTGPAAQERDDVGADMVLAEELKRLADRRIAFMNESVQALLSCRHSSYAIALPAKRTKSQP
jgi:hypothetical protein